MEAGASGVIGSSVLWAVAKGYKVGIVCVILLRHLREQTTFGMIVLKMAQVGQNLEHAMKIHAQVSISLLRSNPPVIYCTIIYKIISEKIKFNFIVIFFSSDDSCTKWMQW